MKALILASLLTPLVANATATTPEAAVAALWQALSNDPGTQADLPTLEHLFHEEAVVFGSRYQGTQPSLRRYSRAAFLKAYEAVSPKGFYECEVFRQVQRFDRFATVYSVVESRSDRSQTEPDFVGVNSLQLYQVGSDWKVLSLYYHVAHDGVPKPQEGGQSGKCLN